MSWLFTQRLRLFVLLAAGASLVLNVAMLMPAIYMMQVFDRVLASGSIETLVMLASVALVFLALGYFMDTVRTRTLAWAGRSLDKKLAPAAIRHSLTQAANGPGRVDTDALRDISQLRTFLSGSAAIALFDAPWLPIYLLLIALMHPLLGLTASLGAIALVVLGILTDRLMREHAAQTVQNSRAAARFAEKLARNAEAIIGMGMADTAVSRWSDHHQRSLGAQARQIHSSAVLSALARSARQVLQVAMLGIGAWLVVDMRASAGIMIAATILLSRALQPVEHLISGWRALVDARGAWQRLATRSIGEAATTKVTLPAPTGRLEIERLTYGFAAAKVALIRNLTFAIEAGESLGVIGASACGKTTLIRLLLGIWKPQAGTVRLDGADIARWDRTDLGEHIGYLPQDIELFGGTVAENIARLGDTHGAEASLKIIRAARLAHAHEMILQLPDGYNTQIGESGAVLSGGQRQRIALARALYGEPKLVVLDEPNANLDAAGEAALLAALAQLKTHGITVIMVCHNPTFMAAMDRLLLLKNGMLDLFGPSASVMARMRANNAGRVVAINSARAAEISA